MDGQNIAIIKIPYHDIAILQDILDSPNPVPDAGRDETIACYTAKFNNGFTVDIKVCNVSEGSPYVDAVLFDENSIEIGLLDVTDELEGEYWFSYEGENYIVIVEGEQ